MQVLRAHNTPRQRLHQIQRSVRHSKYRLRVNSGQARLQVNTPWSVATARTRPCVARSRNYNDAWQLRDDDPLMKEANGCAVVIGAGVAGLASALGLAKWGMSVQVSVRAVVSRSGAEA